MSVIESNKPLSPETTEQALELVFGDGAIDKGYCESEFLEKLREMSDALADIELDPNYSPAMYK
tara:strand:- start:2167 stop:2358 length:192 start_codon:yes stop_codon:yes gene_type:complete